MELKTKIKQFGNSAVIVLTKETMEVGNLEVGDIVDVDVSVSAALTSKPKIIKNSKGDEKIIWRHQEAGQ